MQQLIYLLVVFDLVLGAAAVWVGGLPPHQGEALLLDLLRSQLADQRGRYKEVKKRERKKKHEGFWSHSI